MLNEMYRDKIVFFGKEIKRGESVCLDFDVAKLHTRNSIKVPVFIERAKEDGPVLLFMGGVHGDEKPGMRALVLLPRRAGEGSRLRRDDGPGGLPADEAGRRRLEGPLLP